MKRALFWFRRDLRLGDNPGLTKAVRECEEIVPVFVWDAALLKASDVGPRHMAFLLASLESLSKNLEHVGSRLIIRHGKPEEELLSLLKEGQASCLYWNSDVEPEVVERDKKIVALCRLLGVQACESQDSCIQVPGSVVKADGKPYTVFTPYAKVWKQRPIPKLFPRPLSLSCSVKLKSLPLPELKDLGLDIPLPPAGEKAAHELLKEFLSHGIQGYDTQRDFPDLEGTSRLSPHLRFGVISPRTVHHGALGALKKERGAAKGVDVFISELIWRDFYKTILFYFPHVAEGCFRPEYDGILWENDKKLFQAWCEGKTGYPLVDAAMRQLNQTGWMHNRLRMVVASFLTKDLLVDWRKGERYFMRQLYDGDLAANNGGWQWAAGTGTDAQPYFRIFNPASQAMKFDPEGKFIEKYVPEVDTMKYPAPIVAHAVQRIKALALYKKAKA